MTDLAEAIDDHTTLVSIQWVNNETGVIQPVEAIGAICRERNVRFHTDAAQAAGKVPMELRDLPIDYASFSGHKLHAPQGVGTMWCRDTRSLRPLLHGGSQENSHRAGTENILGIIGFGVAARARRLRFDEIVTSVKALRDEFETRVLADVPQTKVNGATDQRVWNCTNILFEGVDGTALVARLDQEGICCSQGSACTSMRPEPSYVLRAMGLSESEAYASVRFSFSELNSHEDIDVTLEALKRLCSQIRALMGKKNRIAV
jgi:cysteine desulfurase